MKNKILPITLVVMIVFVGIIGYLVYGEYKEYTVSSDNASAEDLSGYPEGVKDGTVSAEYYDDLTTMLTSYVKYAEKMMTEGIQTTSIEYESQQYLVLLNDLDLIPKTKTDSKLDYYAIDFKIQSELVAEYMLDYANSAKLSHKHDAERYIRDTIETYDLIEEMLYKYNLD